MKTQKTTEKKRKQRGDRKSTSFAAWLRVCAILRRKGGFQTALDGKSFRCRIKDEYFSLMARFTSSRWLGWPVGTESFRIVPSCGNQLFMRDRARIERERSKAIAAVTIGSGPLELEFRSNGRLCLREGITRPCKIEAGSKLFVFIGDGFLEVWRWERWIALCEANGAIIHEAKIPPETARPSSTNNIQLVPNGAVPKVSECLIKCESRKD